MSTKRPLGVSSAPRVEDNMDIYADDLEYDENAEVDASADADHEGLSERDFQLKIARADKEARRNLLGGRVSDGMQLFERNFQALQKLYGVRAAEYYSYFEDIMEYLADFVQGLIKESKIEEAYRVLKKQEVLVKVGQYTTSGKHRVMVLNHLGACMRRVNKPKVGLAYLVEALKLAKALTSSELIATTALNLCAVYRQLEDHPRSLEAARRAVTEYSHLIINSNPSDFPTLDEYEQKHRDRSRLLAIAYHNLSLEEGHAGNTAKSLEYAAKAYQLMQNKYGEYHFFTKKFKASYEAILNQQSQSGSRIDGGLKSKIRPISATSQQRPTSRGNKSLLSNTSSLTSSKPPEWKIRESPYSKNPFGSTKFHESCIPKREWMAPVRQPNSSATATPQRGGNRRLSGHQPPMPSLRHPAGASESTLRKSPPNRASDSEEAGGRPSHGLGAPGKRSKPVVSYRNTMKELEELGITSSGSESEEDRSLEAQRNLMKKNRERLAQNIGAPTAQKPEVPGKPEPPKAPSPKKEEAAPKNSESPSTKKETPPGPPKNEKTDAEREAERKERQRKAEEAEKLKELQLRKAMLQELKERNAALSVQRFAKAKNASNAYVRDLQNGTYPNLVFLIRQTLKAREDPNSVQVVAAIDSSNKQQIVFKIFESSKAGKTPQTLDWFTQDCLESKGIHTLVFMGSKVAKKLLHAQSNNLKCEKGVYSWINPSPPMFVKKEAPKPVPAPPLVTDPVNTLPIDSGFGGPAAAPGSNLPAPGAGFTDDFDDLHEPDAIKPEVSPNLQPTNIEGSVPENQVIQPEEESPKKDVPPLKVEEPSVAPHKLASTGSLRRNSMNSARSKKGSTPKLPPPGLSNLRAKGDQGLFKYLYKKEVKPGYTFQVVKDAATMVYLVRAPGVDNNTHEEWVDFVQMKIPVTHLPTNDEGFEAMLTNSQFDVDWSDPDAPIILHHEEESESGESQPPDDEDGEEEEANEEQSDALQSPNVKPLEKPIAQMVDSSPVEDPSTKLIQPVAPVVEPKPEVSAPVQPIVEEPKADDFGADLQLSENGDKPDDIGDEFDDMGFGSGPKYEIQTQRADDNRDIIEVNLVRKSDRSLVEQQLIQQPYLEDAPDIDYNERMLQEEALRWEIDEANGKLVPKPGQEAPVEEDPFASDALQAPEGMDDFFKKEKQYEILSQRLETDRAKIEVVLVDPETREALDIVEIPLVVPADAEFDAEEKLIENEKDNWEYDPTTLKLVKKADDGEQKAPDGLIDPFGEEPVPGDEEMIFGDKKDKYEIVTVRMEDNRDKVEVCAVDPETREAVAIQIVDLPYDENAEIGMNEKVLDDEKEKWIYDSKLKKLIKKQEDSEKPIPDVNLEDSRESAKAGSKEKSQVSNQRTIDPTAGINTPEAFADYLVQNKISWIDIFYQADHRGTGFVSAFELQKALIRDHNLSKKFSSSIIKRIDFNTDGYATIEEIMVFENELPAKIQQSAKYKQHDFETKLFMRLGEHHLTWEQLFQQSKPAKYADQDHISTALLVRSLVKALNVSKTNAKALLQQLDHDCDGCITKKEWMGYLKTAAATIPAARAFYVEETTVSKEAEDAAVHEAIRKQQLEIEQSIQQALKLEQKKEAARFEEGVAARGLTMSLLDQVAVVPLDMPDGDYELYVENDMATLDALFTQAASEFLKTNAPEELSPEHGQDEF